MPAEKKSLSEEMSQLFDNQSKILVIQTAYIGDVILATPLAIVLQKKFPLCTIDYLVKKGNEGLLVNHPNIRKVFAFDKKHKRKSIKNIVAEIRTEKYDVVINLHRFLSSGIITAMSGAKCKIGFKKNPMSWNYHFAYPHHIGYGIHEVDRNLSLLTHFGIHEKAKPLLVPTKEQVKSIEKYTTEPYYCLAPASIWPTKQLPVKKWVELIGKLSGNVFLIGGPSDHDLCEEIRKKAKNLLVQNVAGQLKIMESIALMKQAKRNYVNDSGPMHFASSVNAPVTVFYCSTVPEFGFGPLSDDAIIKEVTDLPCRPCGLHGKKSCPEEHFRCGNDMVI